ncbi:MAG: hypothetical protein JSR78_05305 [Proteobacteria bacterium]|nr:hypothetical protein [Pseudomonadota bacterium]
MDLQDWQALDEIMRQQRSAEDQALLQDFQSAWRSTKQISPIKLLRKINFASADGIDAIFKAHPARSWHDAVDNVGRAFSVLNLSRGALNSVYGVYHSHAVHDRNRPDIESVVADATKEVFAFSFAALSLVEAYRRFESTAPNISARFNQLRREIFRNPLLSNFIQELRNSFSHRILIAARPHYSVKLDAQRTVTTSLQFDREQLSKAKWNSESRQFIETTETLDVMQIISSYFDCAADLHRRYLTETGLEHDPHFKDYLRLQMAREAASHELTLGLVLQATKSQAVNPYPHLARYFTADELQRIRSLDDHSQAQVDYLIGLRDPIGLCSDELRQGLYRLFQVPS